MENAPFLSAGELERFHLNGFLGPYTLCSPGEMAALRPAIVGLLDPENRTSGLPGMISALNPYMRGGFGRHHQNRFLFDLANAAAITRRVSGILGEDLLLWRTMFFPKPAGEKSIPWHQDFDGWEIEPMLVTSCWLAIHDTTPENGCIEVLPGSHRKLYPLIPSSPDVMDGFAQMSDPDTFDDGNRVSMELKAGQFFLFNERVLHRSGTNTTDSMRLGLAMRYIPPLVRILDPGDRAILLNGTDKFHFNELVNPPPAA